MYSVGHQPCPYLYICANSHPNPTKEYISPSPTPSIDFSTSGPTEASVSTRWTGTTSKPPETTTQPMFTSTTKGTTEKSDLGSTSEGTTRAQSTTYSAMPETTPFTLKETAMTFPPEASSSTTILPPIGRPPPRTTTQMS